MEWSRWAFVVAGGPYSGHDLFWKPFRSGRKGWRRRFIYYFGVWEPNLTALIERRLRAGDCFIDVGANVGYFSLLGSKLVGRSGKVVSIEAIPRTFDLLSANVDANSAENVHALNVAVWDKEEELTFFVSHDVIDCTSTAIPSLAEGRGLSERCVVRAARLSSLLEPSEIATARLIKIDVEGAEREAVSGCSQILRSGREDLEVVIEVSIEAFDDVVLFFGIAAFFATIWRMITVRRPTFPRTTRRELNAWCLSQKGILP